MIFCNTAKLKINLWFSMSQSWILFLVHHPSESWKSLFTQFVPYMFKPLTVWHTKNNSSIKLVYLLFFLVFFLFVLILNFHGYAWSGELYSNINVLSMIFWKTPFQAMRDNKLVPITWLLSIHLYLYLLDEKRIWQDLFCKVILVDVSE